MKSFCLCCYLGQFFQSRGLGAGPPHARPRKGGDLGCLPPFLLKSILAPGAAPQPRRIFRRIGYWRVPTDQGESIEYTSRVGGAIFGARGLPKIAQEPSGHLPTPRSISRSRRASGFAFFPESRMSPLSLREDRRSKFFASQKILGWGLQPLWWFWCEKKSCQFSSLQEL